MGFGRNVWFKGVYIFYCEDFVKDDLGYIIEIYCIYYLDSKSGEDILGVKVKGILYWVFVEYVVKVEVC